MSTLFPKKLTLPREGGETLDFTVCQIKLKDYAGALAAVNQEDEFVLCAFACNTTPGAIQQLTPEAFEILLGEVYLANETGFFSYARRRKSALVERAMIREMAAQALAQPVSTSMPPSPGSPPKRN